MAAIFIKIHLVPIYLFLKLTSFILFYFYYFLVFNPFSISRDAHLTPAVSFATVLL